MGRTVMPFSYLLDKEHGRWSEFRKGLSKVDQQAFDRLFDRAKFHTAAGVYMAYPYPLETILLSICLEHEKIIEDILGKLKEGEKFQGRIFSSWSLKIFSLDILLWHKRLFFFLGIY